MGAAEVRPAGAPAAWALPGLLRQGCSGS